MVKLSFSGFSSVPRMSAGCLTSASRGPATSRWSSTPPSRGSTSPGRTATAPSWSVGSPSFLARGAFEPDEDQLAVAHKGGVDGVDADTVGDLDGVEQLLLSVMAAPLHLVVVMLLPLDFDVTPALVDVDLVLRVPPDVHCGLPLRRVLFDVRLRVSRHVHSLFVPTWFSSSSSSSSKVKTQPVTLMYRNWYTVMILISGTKMNYPLGSIHSSFEYRRYFRKSASNVISTRWNITNIRVHNIIYHLFTKKWRKHKNVNFV